jgi:hypothetical protein
MALAGTIAPALPAQPPAPSSQAAAVCFNASPLPRCRSFAVVEVEVMAARARTPDSFSAPNQLSYFGSLGTHVSVELGWVRNITEQSGVGGTFSAGTMSGDGGRFALKGRYRRWLDRQFAIDLEGGPLAVSGGSDNSPFGRNGARGATLGAALAYRDFFALSGSFDAVKGDRAQSGFFIGVRAGSWAAPVFAAGLVALVIATISSIE